MNPCQLKILLLLAVNTLCVSGQVAEFDASNVTEMQFTFHGVPGRDGRDGLLALKDHLVQLVHLALKEGRGQWGQEDIQDH